MRIISTAASLGACALCLAGEAAGAPVTSETMGERADDRVTAAASQELFERAATFTLGRMERHGGAQFRSVKRVSASDGASVPFLYNDVASRDDLVEVVMDLRPGVLGAGAWSARVLLDRSTGEFVQVVLTRVGAPSSAERFAYPSGEEATRILGGIGPEQWIAFQNEPPRHSLLDVLDPGADAPRREVPDLDRCERIVAHLVRWSHGPEGPWRIENAPSWVVEVRDVEIPASTRWHNAIRGHARHVFNAESGEWFTTSNVLGPRITLEQAVEFGVLQANATNEDLQELRLRILDARHPAFGEKRGVSEVDPLPLRFGGLDSAGGVANPTLMVSLISSISQPVNPTAPVDWTISAVFADASSVGLAAFTADIVSDSLNPAQIIFEPAASVPTEMLGFAAPAGVSNPGPSGFGGTPVAGRLAEVGGMQNTFGVELAGGIGQDTTIDLDIALPPNEQIIASGIVNAPAAAGVYSVALERISANALVSIGLAGEISSVRPAQIVVDSLGFSFEVICFADLTGDGMVNLDDIEAFSAGFLAADPIADCDGSGVLSLDDIECFAAAFLAGCP